MSDIHPTAGQSDDSAHEQPKTRTASDRSEQTAVQSSSFPRDRFRFLVALITAGLTLAVLAGCQTPWGRLDEDAPPPVFDDASLEPQRECVVCPGEGTELDVNDRNVIAYVFEGRTLLFSSEECLLAFKRAPYEYVAHH